MGGTTGALIILGVVIAVPAVGSVLFALNMRTITQTEAIARLGHLIETVRKIAEGEDLSAEDARFLNEGGFEIDLLRGLAAPIVAAAGAEIMYLAKRIPLRAAVAATGEVMREIGGRQAIAVLRRLPASESRTRRLRRRTPVDTPAHPAVLLPGAGAGR